MTSIWVIGPGMQKQLELARKHAEYLAKAKAAGLSLNEAKEILDAEVLRAQSSLTLSGEGAIDRAWNTVRQKTGLMFSEVAANPLKSHQ